MIGRNWADLQAHFERQVEIGIFCGLVASLDQQCAAAGQVALQTIYFVLGEFDISGANQAGVRSAKIPTYRPESFPIILRLGQALERMLARAG